MTLVERAVCGAEASWAGAGILAPCDPHRDDAIFQLRERSLALYPELCSSLHDETGIDTEYESCGELRLLFTDEELRIARSDEQAAHGRTTREGRPVLQIHTPDQTAQIEPAAASEIIGSMECRRTAQVRNPRLLRALVTSCLSAGVRLHENTKVEDFVVEGDRVRGVETDGDTLLAGKVILCAGAWSSQLGERLRVTMPVHPVRGQIVLMTLDERPFREVITRGKAYLVPRRDGHVLLGSTEEPEAGFSKRTTAGGVSRLIEAGLEMAPMLADATVEATWSGLRPGTPDEKPYIGPVPGLEGLIAATGHYRAGLALAPATAEAVAAIVQNRPYDIDLACCQPGRG